MSDTDPPVGVPTPPTDPPVVTTVPTLVQTIDWKPPQLASTPDPVVIPDPPEPPPADQVAIPPSTQLIKLTPTAKE
jgi:hypothetical protein